MTSLLDQEVLAKPVTLAGRGTRLLAFAIDLVLYGVGPLLRIVFERAGFAALAPVMAGIWFIGLVITQIVFVGLRGQTIGKRATKIAIVDQFSNEPPGYLRADVVRQGPQT